MYNYINISNVYYFCCVYFLDIAETSVEQSETRYKEMVDRNSRDRYPQPMFSSEFIAADCTKVIHQVQISIYRQRKN